MINYYLLMKPGIIMGNLVTVAAGFLLASKGHMHFGLFLATLLGLGFVMASACIFNNYIDLRIDKQMTRTKDRPLVQGLISVPNALLLATVLGAIGGAILLWQTNLLTFLIAAVGFFVYVILYSLWKCRTVYGTAIGSIAGAVPPVVGYCAVSNQIDTGAIIFFALMVLWQMPHFFSIAITHMDDYANAKVPVLPIEKGMWRTKVHMVLYILGFIPVAVLLTYFGYTGRIYFIVTACLGFAWLGLCLKGFQTVDDKAWGKQMFRLSLLTITTLCIAIPFDTIES